MQAIQLAKSSIELRQFGAAFYKYERFWKSDVRVSFKRNVFGAAVVSTLVSGLVPFAIEEQGMKLLSICYCNMIKKVLGFRSVGIVKSECRKTVHMRKANREVCMKLKVPSVDTTLRIHKLQLLQSILKDRTNINCISPLCCSFSRKRSELIIEWPQKNPTAAASDADTTASESEPEGEAAAEKAAAQKIAAEKESTAKAAAEKETAEKAIAEKAAAEKAAAEKVTAERAAAERLAAEKAENAAAEKAAAEKAAAEMLPGLDILSSTNATSVFQ